MQNLLGQGMWTSSMSAGLTSPSKVLRIRSRLLSAATHWRAIASSSHRVTPTVHGMCAAESEHGIPGTWCASAQLCMQLQNLAHRLWISCWQSLALSWSNYQQLCHLKALLHLQGMVCQSSHPRTLTWKHCLAEAPHARCSAVQHRGADWRGPAPPPLQGARRSADIPQGLCCSLKRASCNCTCRCRCSMLQKADIRKMPGHAHSCKPQAAVRLPQLCCIH